MLGDMTGPAASAARCAPSLAMTREREMRGLRTIVGFGFGSFAGVGAGGGATGLAVLVWRPVARTDAAAPKETGLARTGINEGLLLALRGLLKILPGGVRTLDTLACRGLFVIRFSANAPPFAAAPLVVRLCSETFGRFETELRVLARELAVGA